MKGFFSKKGPPLTVELSSNNEVMVNIHDEKYSDLASFLLNIAKPSRAMSIALRLEEFEALNCPFKISNKNDGSQLILSRKLCKLVVFDKNKMLMQEKDLNLEDTIDVLWSWCSLIQDKCIA